MILSMYVPIFQGRWSYLSFNRCRHYPSSHSYGSVKDGVSPIVEKTPFQILYAPFSTEAMDFRRKSTLQNPRW